MLRISNFRFSSATTASAATATSKAMWTAMATASVGDDVYGEDPTINALQTRVANMLGKPAALLFPTHRMAQICALLVHQPSLILAPIGTKLAQPGNAEGVVVAGARVVTLPLRGGDDQRVQQHIQRQVAQTQTERNSVLFAFENTMSSLGGVPIDLSVVQRIRDDNAAAAMHCDCARLWNAALSNANSAASSKWADLVAPFDSVAVGFKSVGVPMGSLLLGSEDFIADASRARKAIGGGMRQAGVFAAAIQFALDEKLIETVPQRDHEMALRFAEELQARFADLRVVEPSSNIVHAQAHSWEHARDLLPVVSKLSNSNAVSIVPNVIDEAAAPFLRFVFGH